MTFIWRDMLWLLLLLPVLAGLYVLILRRRKRTAIRYANLAMIKQAMGKSMGWRRHVPPALLLLAIGVLIVAVARPAAVLSLLSSRATIILAMDVSGSMRAEDILPSRLEAAQAAAKKFIGDQPADVQVGLVAFAGSALLVQVPTIDHESLFDAIDRFELRRATAVGAGILTSLATIFPKDNFYASFGGTRPGDNRLGLPSMGGGYVSRSLDDQAAQAAADQPPLVPAEPGSYQNAVVILLTDGATTTGPDPLLAGQIAADYGVKVYTVGFGSEEGEIVSFGGRSMRAALDSKTLMAIADKTKGQYFEATSSDALAAVYDTLSTKLISEKKLTEISFIFAGIGALIALLGAGLSLLWFGRIA
jgi:Ca-activated chloride channel family protein